MKRVSRAQKYISSGLNAEEYLKEFEAFQNRNRLKNLLNSKRIGYFKYSSNFETGFLIDIIGLSIPGQMYVLYIGENDWPEYFQKEAYKRDLYFSFSYYPPNNDRQLVKLENYLNEFIATNYDIEDNAISLKSMEEFLGILSMIIFDFLDDADKI